MPMFPAVSTWRSLAGESVRFRWRMGLDPAVYEWGWWLDDIQIYTCAPLSADAAGPYSGSEGAPISLDASGSTGSVVAYGWDLDNDGLYDNGTGVTTIVTYTDNGVYSVGLQVTDSGGYTDTISTSVTVSNVAPLVAAGEDQIAGIGEGVSLDAADFSDAGAADTHTATIDWDDGTIEPGTVSESNGAGTVDGSHSYGAAGTYTVEICVSDDDGDSGCDSLSVSVNSPPSANAAGPYSGSEGSVITLDGSGSTGSIVVYGWDLDNDGHYDDGTGITTAVTYTDNGVYIVGLQVTDNGGYTDTISATVAVSNVTPVVTAGTDQIAGVGETVSLAAAGFSDTGVADTHTATIDWGDGSASESGVVSESAGVGTVDGSHSYGSTGAYTVEICVGDDDGDSDCDSLTVTVNSPPSADAGGPYSGEIGSSIILDGSGSTDADGAIVEYRWDLDNDGLYDTVGITTTVTYTEGGAYTVALEVFDDVGDSAGATATVTVALPPKVAPTAKAAGPYSGDEGSPIGLDGSASTDEDGSIEAYGWDLDNDGLYDNGAGVTTTVTYADDGVYSVGLQVADSDGYTNTTSTTVSVSNLAPVVAAGEDQTVGVGETVSLDAAGFSDAGAADTHTATIDWGDGTIEPGTVIESNGSGTVDGSHSYGSAGAYSVKVCVSDDDGDSACDSLSIAVNSPPSASAVGPYSGDEGSPIMLNASGSTGSIVVYGWDLDNDGLYDNGAGVTTTVTYADDGIYSVGLQVTDDDGYTDTVRTSATVSNVAPVVAAGENRTVGVGKSVSLDAAGFSDAGSI